MRNIKVSAKRRGGLWLGVISVTIRPGVRYHVHPGIIRLTRADAIADAQAMADDGDRIGQIIRNDGGAQ